MPIASFFKDQYRI